MAWDNLSKSSSAFSNQAKNASAFSEQSKNSSAHDNQFMHRGLYFLLQEIGDYLLQENGYKILINDSVWGNQTESASIFANQTKH